MKEQWELNQYEVRVTGWDPYIVRAETRSKARYRAYCQYIDGWTWIPFSLFMRMVTVRAA